MYVGVCSLEVSHLCVAACRNFFPVALKFAQSLPVVGHLFMMLERIPSIAVVSPPATTASVAGNV